MIKSRVEEYLDKWNRNMFLNDFDKRDENAGINIKLREVYLETHLPHYIWKGNQSESNDLKNLLSECIDERNKNKMLLVLGQPGIGKSTLITWIISNFTDKKEDILVYQFANDLKDVDWKRASSNSDLESNTGYLLNKMNIRHNNVEGKNAIEYVKNLSDEELEEWYDETYQMLLLCFLEYDNIERSERVKKLKGVLENNNFCG